MADSSLIGGTLPQTISSTGLLTRTDSSIGGLSGGGYVITWSEIAFPQPPGGTQDIHAQIFDASGNEVGSSFLVNATTADVQKFSQVAGLAGGGFVVTWQSDNQDGDGLGIYAQRYDAAGVAQGSETLVNTTTVGEQYEVEISSLTGGGYVIAWSEQVDNGDGTWTISVKLQEYSSAGVAVGSETTVNSEATVFLNFLGDTDLEYSNLNVTELTGGELAVAWSRSDFGGPFTAQMRLFDAAGVLLAGVIEPEQTVDDNGSFPQQETVALGNGNVLIVYSYSHNSNGSFGVGYGEIFGRIYTSAGVAVGDEFAIDSGVNNRRFGVFAESDGNGGAVVGWSLEAESVNERPLVLQQITQNGTVQGQIIWVDPQTQSSNGFTDITLLANGDLVVAFQTGGAGAVSTIGYRFIHDGLDGRFSAGADTVALLNTGETVSGLEGNDVITGGTGADVISGSSGNDTINGGDGDDVISGGVDNDTIDGQVGDDLIFGDAGSDILNGGSGNDNIDGGAGNDTINGGDDNDMLYGGSGADIINGGAGDDLIYGYSNKLFALAPGDNDRDVNVSNTLNGDAGNDSLFGGWGNDIFNGGDGNDNLFGGDGEFLAPSGDDYFFGSPGNDTIRGINGFNTVDYSLTGIGITLFVAFAGTSIERFRVTIPEFAGDPSYTQDLYDISFVIGTGFDDDMTGNDDDNILEGGGGDDIINGGLGTDTASYSTASVAVTVNLDIQGIQQDTMGAGLDTLTGMENVTGSGFDDTFLGNVGANLFDGGSGNDTISYVNTAFGVSVYLLYSGIDTGGGGVDNFVNVESLTGSTFGDRLAGDGNDNVLSGGGGNDILNGKGGNDTFFGDAGNDRITGGTGNDTMFGGAGDDILIALGGIDTLNGGDDDDFLYGGQDSDTLNGDAGIDNIRGNLGVDTLNGGAGGDTLRGGGSNDILNGDADNDFLFGENHSDTLFGGAGNDSLTGGVGGGAMDGFTDTFIYKDTAGGGGGFDRIKDFENGIDVMDLQSFGFASFAAVQALSSDTGGGLRIDFGGGDVLFVENFLLADFDAGDVLI